ncbi:MAG: hypothetical protein H0U92_11545, partial [Actinobacteria bacterium]|nr:hypothetical protein [Actinomycetota bacterium]
TVLSDDIFGYDGASDSPAYTRPYTGATLTTYLAAGAVSAIDVGGVVTYQHANAHGDIVGTTDTAGTWTPVLLADEYGVTTAAPASRLGWLGKHERFSVGGALGLTRMGVRLYDPRLGRFLQTDPIQGGSANDYDYVSGDPINGFDLGGTCKAKGKGNWLRKRWCNVKNVGGGASRGTVNVAGRAWGHAAGGRMRSCGQGLRMKCVDGSRFLVPWARAGTLGTPWCAVGRAIATPSSTSQSTCASFKTAASRSRSATDGSRRSAGGNAATSTSARHIARRVDVDAHEGGVCHRCSRRGGVFRLPAQPQIGQR